jgi:uncharacterized membrane protein YagU involved in acid resistance
MNSMVAGTVSGLAATLPMTLAMEAMFRELPAEQRTPLPPRRIAMKVARAAGAEQQMNESERQAFTLLAHFGYGAGAGALYTTVARHYLPGVMGGVVYGLGVWAGSYLGLLPALGMHRSATQMPAERNALMLAAHVVWGAALGATASALDAREG